MNNQRLKILLTGQSGYIGSYLYESLKSIDTFELFVLKRNCSKCGLKNCLEWNEIKNYNFDYVINCIGETRVKEKMHNVNNEVCIELFNILNLKSLKKFIHFSTVAFYDQNVSGSINVNSSIKIDSDYSYTKYEFDLFLINQKDFLEKIIIIRPSNVMNNILPGKLLFTLSNFRIQLYSLSKRYVNWCPISLIIEIMFDILQNRPMPNIVIANKYQHLNMFYKTYLSKRYLLFFPIELLFFVLTICQMKYHLRKFNQLFSRSYFTSNLLVHGI